MTISLLLVVPFSLRLAATWKERLFEVTRNFYIENYWMPMGFASLAVICVGLIVIWSGFHKGLRSAWLILFLITWLFYFPVLVFPHIRSYLNLSTGSAGEAAWFENPLTAGLARDLTLHFLGFLFMLLGLLLALKDIFLKGLMAQGEPNRVPRKGLNSPGSEGGEELTTEGNL